MEVLFLLIPLSIVILVIAIWAFFWAIKRGQFNDLDTPAQTILEDDIAVLSEDVNANRSDQGDPK